MRALPGAALGRRWMNVSQYNTPMGKMTRVLGQFSPESWDSFNWHALESPKRLFVSVQNLASPYPREQPARPLPPPIPTASLCAETWAAHHTPGLCNRWWCSSSCASSWWTFRRLHSSIFFGCPRATRSTPTASFSGASSGCSPSANSTSTPRTRLSSAWATTPGWAP